MLRQRLMASHPRPTPYLAASQQRKSTQIPSSARKLQITEQIV
jgi:hypothetical protein